MVSILKALNLLFPVFSMFATVCRIIISSRQVFMSPCQILNLFKYAVRNRDNFLSNQPMSYTTTSSQYLTTQLHFMTSQLSESDLCPKEK